jgi:hypothetical protein
LKAKQSREVQWDAKEDESLIKKVMEMANCNFFQQSDKGSSSSTSTDDSNVKNVNPFGRYTSFKDGASEEELSGSGSGSDSKEDECSPSMRSSGEWNSDKHNVNMSDAGGPEASCRRRDREAYSLSDTCSNCHGSLGSHVNKVVWLEIGEHMARLKLTNTLRTALECKTRFMELLGTKISFSAPNNFCFNNAENGKQFSLKNSGDIGGIGFGTSALRGSGGIDRGFRNSYTGDANDTRANIGIQINDNNKSNTTTAPAHNPGTPNNINLTNCNNNNITINITNSYTTTSTNHNGLHLQQIAHCTTSLPSSAAVKPEVSGLPHPSHLLSKTPLPVPLVKHLPVPPILSPSPPFPSFPHLHVPQAATTPLKPEAVAGVAQGGVASLVSGLESLAAVASILPREMTADYSQF